MKQRGKRIRPSDKDLVFHFTIASLLPVFLLVVGLFHVKTIQQINWQDLDLLQVDKIDIPYLVDYTVSNPINFGDLQNYITSSNTNLFTMPSGRPMWGIYLNSLN